MSIRNARDGGVVGLLSKEGERTADVSLLGYGRFGGSPRASLTDDGVAL